MKNYLSIITGILVALLLSTPSFADDTEIFVGTNPQTGKNNIILSIDTSGSMAAHIINFDAVTAGATSTIKGHPVFNPNTRYDGTSDDSAGCFDDYTYRSRNFSGTSRMPYVAHDANSSTSSYAVLEKCRRDVTTSSSTKGLYDPADNLRWLNTIPEETSDLDCDEAKTALNTVGYFTNPGNICNDDFYNNTLYTGRFLDFVRSLVVNNNSSANNGLPINTDNTLKPWENFFVESRLNIVKDVVNNIINNNENYDINLGLMRFTNSSSGSSTRDGGLVAQIPLSLLNTNLNTGITSPNTNSQSTLRTSIDSFINYRGTPLEETYYESYLYFTGNEIEFGDDSIASAKSGSDYLSPITHACQKNSIIVLSDGEPNSDDEAEEFIEKLTSTSCSGNGDCMDELAAYMNTQDLFPSDVGLKGPDGTTITTDLGIKQTVQTSTIGFTLDENTILEATATAGGGISGSANDADELRKFFAGALSTIIEETSSFTSPSVSVNSFNRLTNDDELFFTMFEPRLNPVWPGNIKQYKLEFPDSNASPNTDPFIVDADGDPAVDIGTGAFRDSARSFWTPSGVIDGNEVVEGGFASRMTTNRTILSNLNSGSLFDLGDTRPAELLSDLIDIILQDPDITIPVDGLPTISGTSITTGTSAPANVINQRNSLIDFMYGITKNGAGARVSTNTIGDPLHSTPIVLNYQPETIAGEQVANQTIFVATNTGFLHALDPTTAPGTNMELFAFTPKDLIPNLQTLSANAPNSAFPKAYGLDGPLSSWIENDNGDGIVRRLGTETNEEAHLYITMRRGGKNVYALKVTDPDAPEFEWEIKGGPGGSIGFEEMGDSWSKVTPARIPVGRETNNTIRTKDVLIFAGGYDPDQDDQGDSTVRVNDDQGRAIYIVDPATGKLLWRAVPNNTAATSSDGNTGPDIPQETFADLNYSIPSNLTIIDVNTDGIADRMYVGDMGGQVWRFDIFAPNTSTTTDEIMIDGGVIADLSTDGDTTNNRKFYYQPSVSRVTDDAFGSYLAIALGSGKRASPKSTQIQDKFFTIRDPFVFGPRRDQNGDPSYDYTSSGNEILDGDLQSIILNADGTTTRGTPNAFGWSITLNSSEKVLAEALTADDKIFFTSYIPALNVGTSDSCDPSAGLGSGRLFAVSLFDGSFIPSIQQPTEPPPPGDPVPPPSPPPPPGPVDLASPGIPPAPQVIISDTLTERENCTSATTATLLVGNEVLVPPICTAPVRTYWNRFDTDPADL